MLLEDHLKAYRAKGQTAFIPFVTAGDPTLAFTGKVLELLDEVGCALCELGIPYSDPIADGPVIQASFTRVLNQKTTLQQILEQAAQWTPQRRMPVVAMLSYAIVFRWGLQRFVEEAKQAGLRGAIIPDLLVEEAEQMAECCRAHDFALIQLVTPATPRERAKRIAETSTGFLYYVSVTGITGERRELPQELVENVAWLKEQAQVPVCVGFGISQPEQARQLRGIADGVIVGSAIMKRIAQCEARGEEAVLADLREFSNSILAELQ